MPNPNYLAGRRLEYDCMNRWKEKEYTCIRASGSHGEYDVVAYRIDRKPEFIQCKRVSTEAEAKRLLDNFRKSTYSSSFYHQVLEVKVKGSTKVLSATM